MGARVAERYQVRWGDRITMWKSSFKAGLFAYGLPLEDITIDEPELTVIRKRNLYHILEKMKGDLPNHLITETVTVKQVSQALDRILMTCDPNLEEVRIKWD